MKHQILHLTNVSKFDLAQKAHVKWPSDGDDNTKFFHNSLKVKTNRKNINGLMVNGAWITNCPAIKLEALRFFGSKINERCVNRPPLINDGFRSLFVHNKDFLQASFDIKEIREAIWNCGGDKAPGPDGFAFKFIKRYWNIIQADIMKFVKHFDEFGSFSRGSNSSFISLFPKVKDTLTLSDYRPISLIGCLYKIIAKTLASRMKLVLRLVIDDS